jgi:hypothetical protein
MTIAPIKSGEQRALVNAHQNRCRRGLQSDGRESRVAPVAKGVYMHRNTPALRLTRLAAATVATISLLLSPLLFPVGASAADACKVTTATCIVQYHGGTITPAVHVYTIYWQPSAATYPYEASGNGASSDAHYMSVLNTFFQSIGGSSYYNILTQYADPTNGAATNSVTLENPTPFIDTNPYPTLGNCTPPDTGFTVCIYDSQLRTELASLISTKGWPDSLDNYFVFFLPQGVEACTNTLSFCAHYGASYHAGYSSGSIHREYTAIADPKACTGTTTIHNDCMADAPEGVLGHEFMEGSNDRGSWTDPNLSSEAEIGDLCNGELTPQGTPNVTFPNGQQFRVQEIWSNWENGCVLTYGGSGSTAVPIHAGWNLVSVSTAGIGASLAGITNSIDANSTGSALNGAVEEAATYVHGRYTIYIPGYTGDTSVSTTQGVFVLSKAAGTWTPSGAAVAASPITLSPGWNLIAAPSKQPGELNDSLDLQIRAANGGTDPVQTIATYATGTGYSLWTPTYATSSQTANSYLAAGLHIPYTAGFWVEVNAPVTFTPH